MVDALPWLATQVVPLAIAGAVLGFLVFGKWGKRSQPNAAVGVIPAGPVQQPIAEGELAGTTDGIGWRLMVEIDDREVDDGLATRRANDHAATTWKTDYLPNAGTLLVMNVPHSGTLPRASTVASTGLLVGLASHAAKFALHTYAAQRFGLARANQTRWDGAQRVGYAKSRFDARFNVFCDPAELKDRLSPGARDALVRAHASGISLLWDRDGLALHWPLAKRTESDIAEAAELGCALAHALEDQAPNPA